MAANHYSAADKVAEASIRHMAKTITGELRVADIGIGTGLLAQQIYDAMPCRIAGLDFSEDMLSVCLQREITEILIKCDVGKDHWPLESTSYDAVISAGLLEYLTPQMTKHFLKESTRVLAHGGIVCFSYVPSDKPLWFLRLWQGKSGNFLSCSYNPQMLVNSLEVLGFKILEHTDEFSGSVFRDGSTYPYRLIAAQKL